MDHIWIATTVALAQPVALFFTLYIVRKYELAKPAKADKTKFITLGPTIMVAYNSPTDFEVWDLEIQSNGYQTNAPYKDVTDLCSENAKRVISEEIVKREKIRARDDINDSRDEGNYISFHRAPKLS